MAEWDVSVAGDVAEAGTALSGLILVYLGAIAVRYEAIDTKSKADKRDYYQRHAWLASIGIVFALVAAFFALIAKSINSAPLTGVAAFALCVSFVIAGERIGLSKV